ncbi:hypothetical protein FPCIR_1488 [Fusarium pseudocircinatum]|uniref:Flavin reductase like domain-containing protein n=1 Tax=Fusarium pseudocircinatum TaxID=56676 RepID=A0A8H5PVN7_9HYPO|nr:hypothetical protein FPCIR_1488 [Fusarium pseudocircinatum]
MTGTHSIITPAIMYWGTPVALITTSNEDGTANIGPISSVWWLGHRCLLGLASGSQTTLNIFRTKQCVINLPSADMAHYINPIAKTTGTPTVPPGKKDRGYTHCKDKFAASGFTQQPSDLVQPPRISECPVQMEAEVTNSMDLMQDVPDRKGFLIAIEVKILRTHVRNDLRMEGYENRIDPDRWRPLIMSFQEFYGLAPAKVAESSLGTIDEEKYRAFTRSDVVKQGGDMDTFVNGDSRSEREMVVKLMVAHFTAVVAFCNWQSLRNEKLDTIEPILFLLSPLIVIAQTALGVVIINLSFISNLALSPKSFSLHVETYARRWNTLFGKKPSPPWRTPTGSLGARQSRFGSAWIRLGRATAIFATLFQFTATIFLYQRRKNLHGWDALTVLDHRTFELSVGGAAVSMLSLALLLKFPGFGQMPETLYIPEFEPDPAVIFCRGDSRRCPSWYQILYASDIGSATSAATWLACVLSSTYKGESMPFNFLSQAYTGIYTEFTRTFSLQISLPMFYLLVAAYFAAFFIIPNMYKGPGFKQLHSLWTMIPAVLVLLAVVLVFFLMFMLMIMPAVLVLIPSLISGPGSIFTMKGYETRAMFSQPPFRPVMNETDCLLLWKDPVAEYLWSLV